jgi:hypothetical protein
MEHDLRESATPTVQAAHVAWEAPEDLGVLPEMFRERAERLVQAQQRAIESLEQRMLMTGRHLAVLDIIPARVTSSGNAAYLDVTG